MGRALIHFHACNREGALLGKTQPHRHAYVLIVVSVAPARDEGAIAIGRPIMESLQLGKMELWIHVI